MWGGYGERAANDSAKGLLAAFMGADMTASMLMLPSNMVVQCFCLTCGHVWFAFQTFLIKCVNGACGEEWRVQAERGLKKIISASSAFNLNSRQTAEWAKSVLGSAKNKQSL